MPLITSSICFLLSLVPCHYTRFSIPDLLPTPDTSVEAVPDDPLFSSIEPAHHSCSNIVPIFFRALAPVLYYPARISGKMLCSFFQRSTPAPPSYTPRPATPPKSAPIMDLSSLDGPPIIASRVLVPPLDPSTPGIHEEHPTPQGAADAYHFERSKPLPERPGRPHRPEIRERINPVRPGSPIYPLSVASWLESSQPDLTEPVSPVAAAAPRSDGHLRRAPARRGRKSPTEELFPQDIQPRDRRSQSPRGCNDLYVEPAHRRARSCSPLVWSDAEEMWVVEGPGPLEFAASEERTSRPPRHQPSGYLDREFVRQDSDFSNRSGDLPPPSYESHEFSPSHVMRMREGMASRWTAVARRVQNFNG